MGYQEELLLKSKEYNILKLTQKICVEFKKEYIQFMLNVFTKKF